MTAPQALSKMNWRAIAHVSETHGAPTVTRKRRRSGLGNGAIANYNSGEADPLKGYCDMVLRNFGNDIAASEYGPWGCEDLATCQSGGRPPDRRQFQCQQGTRDNTGANWCFDGTRWFRTGVGCQTMYADIAANLTTFEARNAVMVQSTACASGYLRASDGRCYPAVIAPQVPVAPPPPPTTTPVPLAQLVSAQPIGPATPGPVQNIPGVFQYSAPAPITGGGLPALLAPVGDLLARIFGGGSTSPGATVTADIGGGGGSTAAPFPGVTQSEIPASLPAGLLVQVQEAAGKVPWYGWVGIAAGGYYFFFHRGRRGR